MSMSVMRKLGCILAGVLVSLYLEVSSVTLDIHLNKLNFNASHALCSLLWGGLYLSMGRY